MAAAKKAAAPEGLGNEDQVQEVVLNHVLKYENAEGEEVTGYPGDRILVSAYTADGLRSRGEAGEPVARYLKDAKGELAPDDRSF